MEAAAVAVPAAVAPAVPPPRDAAAEAGIPIAPLEAAERALAAQPATFGFFQAVRTLERLRPGRARIGRFADPGDEVVRLAVHPSIAFPPSEVHALALGADGPARMSVNFMGLTGPQGVLPLHYTLLVRQHDRAKDGAAGAFLDLFHHRALSLFYRAWEKGRIPLHTERGEEGPLRRHLLDAVGEGGDGAGPRSAPEDALVFYAGLFAPLPRGAVALEQLLGDVFGVPARVEQFVGGWYPLPLPEQCVLGEDGEDAGGQLGLGAVVGDEVWHPQSGIRIRLGPMDKREYDRFLPTGSAYPLVRRLVRFYTHDQFECQLQLVLARDQVPACVIGADEGAEPLGWSTWARGRDFERDADDTVLAL
ncbi:MAG TPA: type VI secretion system baseplate subunit TssG [Longimicrobiaceae bacterium]|nr:type VI secretion system baseplate subunit TssG [Longimicrobiaceae bacterium]